MNVPPEILSAILSHQSKTELKKARHVCKAFDAAAVPHLFNEIFIVARYAQMERATLLASRFRPFVKTLIYCSEFLDPQMDGFVRETHSIISNHSVYCKLREEQEELMSGAEFHEYLCSTLVALPNLQNVILRHLYGSEKLCSYKETCDDNCSRMFNPWSAKGFATINYPKRSDDGFEHTGPNAWRKLLQVLFTSKSSQVRNIVVEGEDRGLGYYGVPISAFRMTPRLRFCAATVLPNLTSLDLNLDHQSPQDIEYDVFSERMVAHILCAAINLKSLAIRLWASLGGFFDKEDEEMTTAFTAMLAGCKMTSLVRLELHLFDFTEAEMMTFIQNSRGIRCMALRDVHIVAGSWKNFFRKIKESFPLLKSFELAYLWDVHNELDKAGVAYKEDGAHRAIERYLSGDGPDPFQNAAEETHAR